jgi:hypothetical protein
VLAWGRLGDLKVSQPVPCLVLNINEEDGRMAKIMVCDICKHEGKLTETSRYTRVKGLSELRIDHCDECKKKIPNKMADYVKFVHKIVYHTELSNEDITRMYHGRIKV